MGAPVRVETTVGSTTGSAPPAPPQADNVTTASNPSVLMTRARNAFSPRGPFGWAIVAEPLCLGDGAPWVDGRGF